MQTEWLFQVCSRAFVVEDGRPGSVELDDVETQAILFITTYVVAQAFLDFVIRVECEDDRLDLFDFLFSDVHRIADDDFVALLARAGSRAIQDAAPRATLAINDIGADACPGVFVPDVDELHGQDAGRFAVVGVKRYGTMIFKIGACDTNAMQFAGDYFSHCGLGKMN